MLTAHQLERKALSLVWYVFIVHSTHVLVKVEGDIMISIGQGYLSTRIFTLSVPPLLTFFYHISFPFHLYHSFIFIFFNLIPIRVM